MRIIVLKTARRAKDIMAIAIADKESAFVGESIIVRYYLYNKIQVNTTDIKRFPKLSKFLNDNSLLNQLWIMDPKKKVSDILKENIR